LISLRLPEMNRFMAKLLKGESFDEFLLKEGYLRTGMEYRFQGHIFPEYFDTEERENLKEEFVRWSEVKPVVFELIKGKKTPLAFSFTMLLSCEDRDGFLREYGIAVGEDHPSLYLQIRFEHGIGRIVTGTARNTFTLDKSMDEAWDAEVVKRLKQMEIAAENE